MTQRRLILSVIAFLVLPVVSDVGQDRPRDPVDEVPKRDVKIDGDISLHVLELCEGDPVVFLHGATSDAYFWTYQIQAFARAGFRAISYSRRYNHPNQNKPQPNHSAVVDAKDLASLLDKLEIKQAHLGGHSYGAYSSLLFALEHPDRVKTLTLAEAPIVPWLENMKGDKETKDAAKAH